MAREKYSLAMLMAALPLAAAHADIGLIGSPGTPSNLAAPVAADPAAEDSHALLILIIYVKEGRAHYVQKLTEAIVNAERAKKGVIYTVVSYVPIGRDPARNEMLDIDADNQLEDVVQEMVNSGVDPARIHAMTEVSSTNHEQIRIFTN